MDIIIAGAGGVGFRLAETLCSKHNVTVIDKNEDALNRLQESIDILAIAGNIEDPKTYQMLTDKDYGLFVAVTDIDEANIISTLIAEETIEVKDKIIRLKNDFFAKSSIGEKLGISASVFPFSISATSVEALLNFPKANNVKSFSNFTQKLISVRAQSSLSYDEVISDTIKITGIERDKNFFIPNSYENIQKNDLIYLFGNERDIKELCAALEPEMPDEIKNIAIFGADVLGVEIAMQLSKHNINIKLMEKDLKRCENASDVLQENVAVINSKYGDYQLFKDEGLKNADMLIASTKNDEENIIKCLEAKEYGIKKVVAINNDIKHYYLMHKLGIITVRGPKTNAYYSILEKISSTSLISQRQYCGGKGILLSRKILKNSILLDTKISPYKKDDACTFVVREDKIQMFSESRSVEVDDVVVVFGLIENEESLKKWISSL